MNTHDEISRRRMLAGTAASVAAVAMAPAVIARAAEPVQESNVLFHGRINQSVCQWCFGGMPVEELAKNASRIGLKGIDLVGPEHFATLKKYNLSGTMTTSHGITK